MTPAQFLARVKRNEAPPVCLFLGLEGYNRKRCVEALTAAARAAGVEPEQHDASQMPLAAIVDDARSLSLFASERLVFVRNAETAMPRASRSSAAASDDEDPEDSGGSGGGSPGDVGLLEAYVKSPTPGVTLVFEATRWDFEGDDKTKVERVRKYYAAIAEVVEFRRFSVEEARTELDRIAKAKNVNLDSAAAGTLVEALAADVSRIAVELEKLSLYGKPITAEDLQLLVPDARQSTIFSLVAALGRRDRAAALATLDALVREGEYLPLALTFLASQFRMALVAKEANLRGAMGVQGHFQKAGIPMWGSRAEQVAQTAAKFSKEQLERGLKLIFEADRDLRSARPDDRVIVESFVVRLCG
jgi:DNA polymerase-3 subunit delta